MTVEEIWETARYRVLLDLAARSRFVREPYARIVAAVEARLHLERSNRARDRIARATGIGEEETEAVFRRCLASEAYEEADIAWLRRRDGSGRELLRSPTDEPPHSGPCIYVSLHLGNPLLAFLHLRLVRQIAIRVIARPLDAANPMTRAKRSWGESKMTWLAARTGADFLGVDARSTVQAREELLAGRSLFSLVDIPDDVVARTSMYDLFGERIRLSSGVLRLASLTKVPVVPILGCNDGAWTRIQYGPSIDSVPQSELERKLNDWIAQALECHADQWWFWPFVSRAA